VTFTVTQVPAPADHFRIVSNDFLRGRLPVALTALERVLLGYLISLPTGWRMDRRQLDKSVLEGRDAVSNALQGLERKGYVSRSRRHTKKGTWVWTWRVTPDPLNYPLPTPEPSTGTQSMDATSGNTTKPQVAPSTGEPSTVDQSILEDGTKKTDHEDGGASSEGNSVEGTHVMAHADAHAAKTRPKPRGGGVSARSLLGLNDPALTKRLVSVWSAVVLENGGALPLQETGGWEPDGYPVERGKHPVGSQLKDWFKDNHDRSLSVLADILKRVRAHAAHWAEMHPDRTAGAA
jgi:hypothetical protein